MQLHTKALTIGYKLNSSVKLLENVTISGNTYEIIALLGLNGTGKSTLIKTLLKLLNPLKGEICINNININTFTANKLAKTISYVSTEIAVVTDMRVHEMVELGRTPYSGWMGVLSNTDYEKVEEAINLLDIKHLKNKKITAISDGERQRVMIARALAQDTPFIILDEPTAFLDLLHKYDLIIQLKNLAHLLGKCIIFSTHDLNIAFKIADKIWLLHQHQIEEGAPEDLIYQKIPQQIFKNERIFFDADKTDIVFYRNNFNHISVINESRNPEKTEINFYSGLVINL